MDVLFADASQMSELAGYLVEWIAYGIGLTVIFWTLGYLVWFIVGFFR